jgi:Ca2+/H+ antiporter, TMEM165/GDT1 family
MGSFLATFLAVFLAELPDKTMIATLVLTARYQRPFAVWSGVAGAFVVSSVIATLAGGALSRLPDRVVSLATGLLFTGGAVLLWRQRNERLDADHAEAQPRRGIAVAGAAFATVVVAEIGDLTQLTIAGLSARSDNRLTVLLGGVLALWAVAALAAISGRALLARLPTRALHIGAASIFAALAAWSFASAIG